MKFQHYIGLATLMLILTACPQDSYLDDLKRLQENDMDFPDLYQENYMAIDFMISDMFETDYSDNYVLTDDAKCMVVYGIDVNFSVEVFDASEAEVIQYSFDDEISAFDAVHDHYVIKRQESLQMPVTSIKKKVPSSVGLPGYIQVIHGNDSDYGENSSYFTATLKVDDEYYVFQLIGVKENMGYLYDDFIDILSSVER